MKSAKKYLEDLGIESRRKNGEEVIEITSKYLYELLESYANERLKYAADKATVEMLYLENEKPTGLYMIRDGYAYQVDKNSILN
jgi:hypothetical protein